MNAQPSIHQCLAILAVHKDSDQEALKAAYRAQSLRAHPDQPGGSEAQFQLVATAYEMLSQRLHGGVQGVRHSA